MSSRLALAGMERLVAPGGGVLVLQTPNCEALEERLLAWDGGTVRRPGRPVADALEIGEDLATTSRMSAPIGRCRATRSSVCCSSGFSLSGAVVGPLVVAPGR